MKAITNVAKVVGFHRTNDVASDGARMRGTHF
jgi:hypothetical protein